MKKLIFNLLNNHQENRTLHYLLNSFSNNGVEEEEASEEDWIFGMSNANKTVLREDGQWDMYLPAVEVQKKGSVETMACVSFSCNNVLETLAKRKYDEDWNKSDRFLAKMSNTTRRGNAMKKVIDTVRHYGAIDEERWSFDENIIKTWSQYYSTINKNTRIWAKEFLDRSEVQYDTIFNRHPQAMMEALKYSPIWVAGYAWGKGNDGLYHSWGGANHAFMIYGYEEGKYWKVYDSYSPYKKCLAWDFKFFYPKTIYLASKDEKQRELDEFIRKGFKYIMRSDVDGGGKGQIYEVTKNGLRELGDNEKIDQKDKNSWVQRRMKDKIITGVTEEKYNKLI